MDTLAAWAGTLEIRQENGASVLSGKFRYGTLATVRNQGRERKERIGPDAFGWQIREFAKLQTEMSSVIQGTISQARREILEEQLERRNVHILSGHDYSKPLGDMKRGTARVTSNAESLDFEVDLPDEADMPTYMLDAVKQVRTGRAGGLSPGFFVPPRDVVGQAERLTPEPGNPGVSIREVLQAVMPEMSIVSRPAYGSTTVDLRAEDMEELATVWTPRSSLQWL